MIKSKKNWDTSFQNACQSYIDPVLCSFFTIKYQRIAYESWAIYTNKNIVFELCFELPIFPYLSFETKDTKGKSHTKIIKAKDISKELAVLSKTFLTLDSSNLSKWMTNCKKGEYDDLMFCGIKLISEFLDVCINEQEIVGIKFQLS
ncbi:MAG: hypothetical protein FWH27_14080 [Planctomycetaceae bacterium]|nr:hypothetical protein [Planctomycetaceae bacterium]